MKIKQILKALSDSNIIDDWRKNKNFLKSLNRICEDKMKSKELNKLIRNEFKKNKHLKDDTSNEGPLNIISSKTLMKSNIKLEWIINGLLPKGSLVILSGRPGSFKTWTTLHIAISISQGSPVFNHFETKKNRVLIIDEEDSKVIIKNRFELLGIHKDTDINLSILSGFKIDNEEHLDLLIKEIKNRKIGVIIIDSLIRIHSGDENSARDMSKVNNQLKKLVGMGIAIIINHHNRKSQNNKDDDNQAMRGSIDILAGIDSHLMIHKSSNELIIKQSKNRFNEEKKSFSVKVLKNDNNIKLQYDKEYSDNQITNKNNVHEMEILNYISNQKIIISQSQIFNYFNGKIGKNKILTLLETLINKNQIKRITKEHGKKYYLKS